MKETNFKMTEIGLIPKDWEVKALSSIGSLAMCKRVFQEQTTLQGDIPFYKIGTFGKKADAFISNDLYEYLRNTYRFPRKGEILISAAGTIGRTVVFDGKPSYFQDSNIIWLAHNQLTVVNSFLYYSYQTINWDTENTTIARLYNDNFNNTKILVPPLSEQTRIASALSEVDALLTSIDKVIAKKQAIKEGTMQQLLTGKTRLEGFDEEWEEVVLGTGLKFQCGAPFDSTYFKTDEFGPRLIRNRDLKTDDQVVYYSGEYSADYIVNNDDILIGMDGDFLPCRWSKGTALLNQRVGRIVMIGDWDKMYLYYALKKPLLEKQEDTGATTVKHLSHKDVEMMTIFMPTNPNEQQAIASILTSMDSELSALQAKRKKYEAIKQGMMQQLLTGKVRLI